MWTQKEKPVYLSVLYRRDVRDCQLFVGRSKYCESDLRSIRVVKYVLGTSFAIFKALANRFDSLG